MADNKISRRIVPDSRWSVLAPLESITIERDAQSTIKEERDAPPTLDDFFNPENETMVYEGHLPHWQQENVWYFVTFRLADSIPDDVVKKIRYERELWLKQHSNKTLTKQDKIEYYRLFSEKIETLLAKNMGSCILRKQQLTKIVADALKYFDGDRYNLDAWVIMPNHVHVLVQPLTHSLEQITHSWKSFTAHKINKIARRSGQLWQHESYDHIVRNERSFYMLRQYIYDNPKKAGIVLSRWSVPDSRWSVLAPQLNNNIERDAQSTFNNERDAPPTVGDIND
jgi:REP element-mobilizing transposase RayT